LIWSVVLFAYFVGAIPFGYIVYQHITGNDVRSVGSGNIGATNILRTLGKKAGITVLLGDCLKGVIAVQFAMLVATRFPLLIEGYSPMELGIIAGLTAIAGHMFPIYLRFKGGKGVATALGVFLPLVPYAMLCVVVVFVLTVWLTRFVSLGSILGAATLPMVVYWLYSGESMIFIVSLLVSFLVMARHAKNFARLVKGQENRISFTSGK
jgi:glycerol-3-phosphate acyltransferase PlsY